MASQLRQIGVADTRQANVAACRLLRDAQHRLKTLLQRPSFPKTSALLTTLTALQRNFQKAQQWANPADLAQLCSDTQNLYNIVDRCEFFGQRPNGTTKETLRLLQRRLGNCLSELTEPNRPEHTDDTQRALQQFCEDIETRGWRISSSQGAPTHHEIKEEADAYVFLHDTIAPLETLLDSETDFGFIEAPIILLPGKSISEATLLEWTRAPHNQTVYCLFGNYIVIPKTTFLGISANIMAINKKSSIAVRTNRVEPVLNYLLHGSDRKYNVDERSLIKYPRRVRQHYYYPVINIASRHYRHFRRWNMLIKEKK